MVEAKYLALGDSYTIGESVSEEERFPAQTAKLLKAENINVTTLKYIAATGWTSLDLASAINAQNPAKDFKIVTLLIGVNDQYQARGVSSYRENFSALLFKSVELAGDNRRNVFVLSIPDYSVTPFVAEKDKSRVSSEINEFNAINEKVTLQNGITYIDITEYSRQAKNHPALIADDSLHPSNKQYAAWAGMLTESIKKVLIGE